VVASILGIGLVASLVAGAKDTTPLDPPVTAMNDILAETTESKECTHA
jgi:hypothetical protein